MPCGSIIAWVVRVCMEIRRSQRKTLGELVAAAAHCRRVSLAALEPGQSRDFGWGRYCKTRPVRQRIVAYWRRRREEPWILATNLAWGARKVARAHALRMKIEELFRDEKNLRFGWGLRQSRLSSPRRLERPLLVLAFAYLYLLLLGVHCVQTRPAKHWSSTNSPTRPASVFFIARCMQDQVRVGLSVLLNLLRHILSEDARRNWGWDRPPPP